MKLTFTEAILTLIALPTLIILIGIILLTLITNGPIGLLSLKDSLEEYIEDKPIQFLLIITLTSLFLWVIIFNSILF